MSLKEVEKATKRLVAAQTHQRAAMLRAHEEGVSMRQIAHAAGVSHTQVQRILSR